MKKDDKFIQEFVSNLRNIFPNPKCELEFSNNFELLIAVMLSAQCTDKRVNKTTKILFDKLKTPLDFANADIAFIENLIKPCGLYKSKAKHIKSACIRLVEVYNSEVPFEYEDLMSLDGVGRKTANVVRAVGFKIPSVAVDTHVLRVSNRLGFYSGSDPNKCEKSLCEKFKKEDWIDLHYLMVLFGRYQCKASIKNNSKCENCVFKEHCKLQ